MAMSVFGIGGGPRFSGNVEVETFRRVGEESRRQSVGYLLHQRLRSEVCRAGYGGERDVLAEGEGGGFGGEAGGIVEGGGSAGASALAGLEMHRRGQHWGVLLLDRCDGYGRRECSRHMKKL